MKQFKSRKEIEKYFGNEVFKFTMMSENTIFFESLNPVFIDDKLYSFELSFYYKHGCDFFTYSSFKDWFDKFQLSQVKCISQETHESTSLYFSTYEN